MLASINNTVARIDRAINKQLDDENWVSKQHYVYETQQEDDSSSGTYLYFCYYLFFLNYCYYFLFYLFSLF